MRNSWKNKPDNSLSHYFTESKMFLEYTSKKKKKTLRLGVITNKPEILRKTVSGTF